MGGDGICDTRLVLRLGYDGWTPVDPRINMETPFPCSASSTAAPVEPSLTLSLPTGTLAGGVSAAGGEETRLQPRQSSPHSHSTVSSFSGGCLNSTGAKIREKDVLSEEVEAERTVSGRASDEEDEGSARKKLRLTKGQSALLEDMFKEHSTLNPKQKQALAKRLNLRPRQVEVWFQNRRARTKLKQTETDCELLRRCCESLSDENRRLQKELQELRALKRASPFYMQFPAATLTVCPSCERVDGAAAGDVSKKAAGGGPFVIAPKPAHFYKPFAAAHSPPAAC